MSKAQSQHNIYMLSTLVLICSIIITLLAISLLYGNRIFTTHVPLADAAMKIKLEVSTARLQFEEILSGQHDEPMENIWRHLDTANWYATAMLDEGYDSKYNFHPLTDERMRREITQVKKKIAHFRRVIEHRFKNRERSLAESDLDPIYERIFDDLLALVDSAETHLQQQMKQELLFFNKLSLGLIIMVVISVVFASILFYRYQRKQAYYNQELSIANQKINLMLDNLEDKVAERTHELARANEKLQQLDRLKSMFIASVSHELRTPLNSIIGFSGMMLQNLTGEINKEQRDYLQRIENSGKHQLSLISDVIDISKIEAGWVEAAPTSFKLHELLNETIEHTQVELGRKALMLHSAFPDNIEMFTDRPRLYQCLLNLLNNAIKYSERGEVRLSTRIDGPNIEIAVEDDGIGIGKSDMLRLFQPFERIYRGNGKQTSGTGLGLYLTRKIITEILKGNISAESQAGVGSRFSMRIPMQLEVKG